MEKLNNFAELGLIFKYALKDLSRNYKKISSIIITLFISLFILSAIFTIEDSLKKELNENAKTLLGGDLEIDYNTYINAGVVFFSKKHLDIFKQVLDFYLENREELDNWNKGGGKEQTIFNFHLVKNNVNLKLLKPEWNLISIHRKDMFSYNWQLNEDQTPFFIKYGYHWKFSGMPKDSRTNLMKQTWDIIGHNYESKNSRYQKILNSTSLNKKS